MSCRICGEKLNWFTRITEGGEVYCNSCYVKNRTKIINGVFNQNATIKKFWKPQSWNKECESRVDYIRQNLDTDEKIIAAITGMAKSKIGQGLLSQTVSVFTVMACTNKRIIVYGKTAYVAKYETYPLNQNVTFNIESGMLIPSLVIRAANDIQKLEGVKVKEAQKFVELVNQQIHQPQKTKITPEDPLQILKIRFAKGEITKEEYEEMKKILE